MRANTMASESDRLDETVLTVDAAPADVESAGRVNLEPDVYSDYRTPSSPDLDREVSVSLTSETFSTGRFGIPTTEAFMLAAYHRNRVRLTIRNTDSTNPVYVGSHGQVTAGDGFPILAGDVLVLETRGAVFAIASGGEVSVSVLTELERRG